MMILALINNKGGVGKTTTVVNVGAALAREGKRVLIVDLDSQGAASLSCGLRRDELKSSVADVLFNNAPISSVLRETTTPNMKLLPGSHELTHADVALAALPTREHTLAHALNTVRADFDVILIDCPPSLSALSSNALVAADQYLVPVPPHYLAIGGLASLLDAVNRMCDQTDGNVAELMGFVLTLVDYRNRTTTGMVESLRKHWNENVLKTEIRVNVKLTEAPAHGQSIFDYASDSTGAKSYKDLAREIQQRHKAWLKGADAPADSAEPLSSIATDTVPSEETPA